MWAGTSRAIQTSFYRFVDDRKNARKNVGPLWKETGELVTRDMEKY